jgi:hypothetical protein
LLSENNTIIESLKCVPVEYGPMAVMYKHANGNYIVKRVSRMSVKICQCR